MYLKLLTNFVYGIIFFGIIAPVGIFAPVMIMLAIVRAWDLGRISANLLFIPVLFLDYKLLRRIHSSFSPPETIPPLITKAPKPTTNKIKTKEKLPKNWNVLTDQDRFLFSHMAILAQLAKIKHTKYTAAKISNRQQVNQLVSQVSLFLSSHHLAPITSQRIGIGGILEIEPWTLTIGRKSGPPTEFTPVATKTALVNALGDFSIKLEDDEMGADEIKYCLVKLMLCLMDHFARESPGDFRHYTCEMPDIHPGRSE